MVQQVKNFIKAFDFFDKPFAFFVGEKKNKSTLIGGFLSISVVAVSIAYFYYLLNMYFDNKFEPKITSSLSIEDEYISLNVTESFFIFEYLINGEPIKEYEKRKGKTYLSYAVSYDTFDPNGGKYSSTKMPLVECPNTKFKGFLCIESSLLSSQNIQMEPIKNIWTQYSLLIGFCNHSIESNCATEQETLDLVLQRQNFMQLYTKIRQYSPDIRDYKEAYKSEYLNFDPKLVLFTRISMIKASTTVKEGLIIQTASTSEDIFDYKRIDTYFSKENVENQLNFYGFAIIVFENNQMRNIISVQHAMITEVLAQFMGIVNPLLIIGILAKMLAASQIIEDINNILLKEYYKLTALKLVRQREIKLNAHTELSSKQLPNQPQTSMDEPQAIVSLQKKINEADFSEQSTQLFEMGFYNRAKAFFGNLLGIKINLDFQKKGSDSMIYQQIHKQSLKRINIFEVYKDIIKLKMFAKLMLSQEQYAAMQFCGSELSDEYEQPQRRSWKSLLSRKSIFQNKASKEKEYTLSNSPSPNWQKSSDLFIRDTVAQVFGLNTIKQSNDVGKDSPSRSNFGIAFDNTSNNQVKNPTKETIQKVNSPIANVKKERELQRIQPEKGKDDSKIKQISVIKEKQTTQTNEQNTEQLTKQAQIEANRKITIENVILKDLKNDDKTKFSFQTDFHSQEAKVPENRTKEQVKTSKHDPFQTNVTQGLVVVQHNGDLEIEIDKSSDLQEDKQKNNQDEKQSEIVICDTPKAQLMEEMIHKKIYRYKSHLLEMDLIEENKDLQESLLQTFLINFHSNVNADPSLNNVSNIDKNIFGSLLAQDKPTLSESQ